MSLILRKARVTQRDAVRGGIAGAHGVVAREAANALYAAGGRAVLSTSLQGALRGAVEREASTVLASVGMLEAAARSGASVPSSVRALEGGTARALLGQSARAATRQALRAVGSAAGAGALLDGGWACIQAIRGLRSGAMTRRTAAVHVAREASTGAAATAVGATAAVMLVALTGGVAAPAVFLVGAAASIGTKSGLNSWLDARQRSAIQAERTTPPDVAGAAAAAAAGQGSGAENAARAP